MAKKTITDNLLALLKHDSLDLQMASLRVAGALGITDKRVRDSITAYLASGQPHLKKCACEVVCLSPRLLAPDDVCTMVESGEYHANLLEPLLHAWGAKLLPRIRARIPSCSESAKRLYVSALLHMKTREAVELILVIMHTSSLDTLKMMCFSLKEWYESLSTVEKKSAYADLCRHCTQAEKNKHYMALTSFVILMGALKYPPTKKQLLIYAKDVRPECYHVRRNAVLSLARIGFEGAHTDLVEVFIPFLVEGKDAAVAKAVSEALRMMSLTIAQEKRIAALLDTPFPEKKRFALSCLVHTQSPEIVRRMIHCLRDTDGSVRDSALSILQQIPSAPNLVVGLIGECVTEQEAGLMALILKNQQRVLTPSRCASLWKQCDHLFIKQDERYKMYFSILRIVVPDFLYKVVFQTLYKQVLKGEYALAEKYSELLSRNGLVTEELTYYRALLALKLSHKDVSFTYRSNDKSLYLFEQLVKSDIALIKRLKKEKVIAPEDLFYIGFHFSEKLFDLRDFGLAVLAFIVKTYPRNKITPKAKQKIAQCSSVSAL